MSGHSVSAADEKIIGPLAGHAPASPNGHRQCGLAGNNWHALKSASIQDVSMPGVAGRTLGSADSRSSDVNGSAAGSVDGVGEGAERAVLLATKVHVPAIGGRLVERAALLDALSAGRHRKLTLLSAPAGRARRLYWRSGLWMPVNLHLVLATRSDPMLPLARLRASADLVEMQPRRCWSAPRSSRTSVITRRRRQRGTTVSGFFSHRALASPTHDTAARGW